MSEKKSQPRSGSVDLSGTLECLTPRLVWNSRVSELLELTCLEPRETPGTNLSGTPGVSGKIREDPRGNIVWE